VDFLTDRYPGYVLVRAANEDPAIAGGPLYLMGFGDLTYWYQGPVLGDYFGPARYRQVLATDPDSGEQKPDPARMRALADSLGVRAVLVERSLFPGLDHRIWSQHFRLVERTDLGSLWFVGGGGGE
jgi:hypothetical protein